MNLSLGWDMFGYSPNLADLFTPTGAILLCWLLHIQATGDSEAELTHAELMEATGLSEKNIATAKRRLKGVVIVREKRIAHRTFYSVDLDALEAKIRGAR